ncbi:MAG: hypothetical protein H6822_31210 [Planctomycetaceae bacterium]|nr:hypothetical protein [Planctomycetales bacterium]MCB9926650.1 hypothetical protein [Planctomycetaceae bacterium]
MTPKLNQELTDALHASESPLSVVDPTTNQLYIIVDQATHQQAMAALQRQQSVAAIQEGIDDMEAGRMQPAAEAQRHGREELLSRFQQ